MVSSDRVKQHGITLRGERVVLRPLTENDWGLLGRWNSDPEVLWFSEGDDVQSYRLEEVQAIYREVSQTAFCFIIEVAGEPIGECWLQEMNLDRILCQHPSEDCRRIDLMIGQKGMWGQGYGTETIGVLTAFGFEREDADLLFGCGIADYNPRSLKAFLRNGYQVCAKIVQPPGRKSRYAQDVVLAKGEYLAKKKEWPSNGG